MRPARIALVWKIAFISGFFLTFPQIARASEDARHELLSPPFLEHIGIYAKHTKQTARFLNNILGLRLNTVKWEIKPETPQSGGVKLGFVDGNGIQFTLIEPTTPGPTLDDLRRYGNGALAELDFEVENFDATYDSLERQGVRFVNMDGKPFPPGQRGWFIESFGLSLVYLPKDLSRGMTIEMYQRGPKDRDILTARDEKWKEMSQVSADAPIMRRILVLAKDLNASAKFLEGIMHLSPIGQPVETKGMRCLRFDAGRGSEIELVEPAQKGPIKQLLEAKGDGFAAGLVFETSSMAAFRRHATSRKIKLIPTHSPGKYGLVVGCEATVNTASYASIPVNVSHGMRITIAEPLRRRP